MSKRKEKQYKMPFSQITSKKLGAYTNSESHGSSHFKWVPVNADPINSPSRVTMLHKGKTISRLRRINIKNKFLKKWSIGGRQCHYKLSRSNPRSERDNFVDANFQVKKCKIRETHFLSLWKHASWKHASIGIIISCFHRDNIGNRTKCF